MSLIMAARRLSLVLCLLLLSGLSESYRIIVVLDSEPLRGRGGATGRSLRGILSEQDELLRNLTSLRSTGGRFTLSSTLDHRGTVHGSRFYRRINALSLQSSEADLSRETLEELRSMPGVRLVAQERKFRPLLFRSVEQVGAGQVDWGEVTGGLGRDQAGRGQRIAVVDSGLNCNVSMMSGAGFSLPENISGLVRGETANVNNKVLVSKAFFNPADPPTAEDSHSWPGPGSSSHGTHVASTAAGVGVIANMSGRMFNLSGVAPASWVMNYRVFYTTSAGEGGGHETELMAALEQAAEDGATVISNSWGSFSAGTSRGPLETLVGNLVAGGVSVVFAVGNSGPDLHSAEHPSDAAIRVGAVTKSSSLSPASLFAVPALAMGRVPMIPVELGLAFTDGVALSLGVPTTQDGCTDFTVDFKGTVAVVPDTGCHFTYKAHYAAVANAAAVVIFSSTGNSLRSMPGYSTSIPCVYVGATAGSQLRAMASGSGGQVTLTYVPVETSGAADVLASFSSRGPSSELGISPDVSAPGVQILAAGFAFGVPDPFFGYGVVSGTSMACPHVAGAAALVHQRNPGWKPAQIKSSLMSTAVIKGVLAYNGAPAQSLDTGSGRIDVRSALSNTLLHFSPPSLSFGLVPVGETSVLTLTVTPYVNLSQVTVAALYHSGQWNVTASSNFVVVPATFEAVAGVAVTLRVSFGATGKIPGDYQGLLAFGATLNATYHQIVPMWARVVYADASRYDSLVVDADPGSCADHSVLAMYTTSMNRLGRTFQSKVWDCAALQDGRSFGLPYSLLYGQYRSLVIISGDAGVPQLLEYFDNFLRGYVHCGGRLLLLGAGSVDAFPTTTYDSVLVNSFLYSFGGCLPQASKSSCSSVHVSATAPSEFSKRLGSTSLSLTPSTLKANAMTDLQDPWGHVLLLNSQNAIVVRSVNSDPASPTDGRRDFSSNAVVSLVGLHNLGSEALRDSVLGLLLDQQLQSLGGGTLSMAPGSRAGQLSLRFDTTDPKFVVSSIVADFGDSSPQVSAAVPGFNGSLSVSHGYKVVGLFRVGLLLRTSLGRAFLMKGTSQCQAVVGKLVCSGAPADVSSSSLFASSSSWTFSSSSSSSSSSSGLVPPNSSSSSPHHPLSSSSPLRRSSSCVRPATDLSVLFSLLSSLFLRHP